ncbi:MAG TPA: hypothetical protein VGR98_24365, partial [Streptosporangiaceae bacterium]|nr:hypothetical protein [Streptosporangiaceae bacterium]
MPAEEVGVGLTPVVGVARGRVPTEPPLTPREELFGAVEGGTPVPALADALTTGEGPGPGGVVLGGVVLGGVVVGGVVVGGVVVGGAVLGVGVGAALGLGVAEHAGLGAKFGPCVLPGKLPDVGRIGSAVLADSEPCPPALAEGPLSPVPKAALTVEITGGTPSESPKPPAAPIRAAAPKASAARSFSCRDIPDP